MDGQMDTFPQGKLTVRCGKTSECKSLSKRVKPHGGFPHRVADTVPTGARHQSAALLIADHLVHGCRYCSLPKSSSFSEGSSILQNIYLSIYLSYNYICYIILYTYYSPKKNNGFPPRIHLAQTRNPAETHPISHPMQPPRKPPDERVVAGFNWGYHCHLGV